MSTSGGSSSVHSAEASSEVVFGMSPAKAPTMSQVTSTVFVKSGLVQVAVACWPGANGPGFESGVQVAVGSVRKQLVSVAPLGFTGLVTVTE